MAIETGYSVTVVRDRIDTRIVRKTQFDESVQPPTYALPAASTLMLEGKVIELPLR